MQWIFLSLWIWFVARLDDYLQVLEKEVNIDFCRSMNRIIFDKTVESDPFTFGFVTQPEEANVVVPEKGRHLRIKDQICRI